jgi:hypothetical protein
VRWPKTPLAIQMQHRPLSPSSRALLPASSARSLAAQASGPPLLLPAGGRDRPLHLTWWRGRGSPSPTALGARSRGKEMDEPGWSYLPISSLVSMREGFWGVPLFPLSRQGGAARVFPSPSIEPASGFVPARS